MINKIIIITLSFFITGCATTKTKLKILPKPKTNSNASIDMRDKTITTYIIFNAYKKLEKLNVNDVLEIITDNYEAIENDIKAWSRVVEHNIIDHEKQNTFERFYIKKGVEKKKDKKLAMIIGDEGLLELLSPLGFALAAALENTEVYIYFNGPAVRVLKKGFKGNLKGLSRPFSIFPRKGLNKAGHVLPQEKVRQLKELGAKFYICAPSMDHFGVKKDELIFDDVIISEYLTFMEIMRETDIEIFVK